MELTRFEKFREGLAAHLPGAIDEILKKEKGSDFCEIGFMTTDDFYGCFITWDTSGCIDEYFDWDQQLEPETDFLYQPLVEVVDACKDIDLCTASRMRSLRKTASPGRISFSSPPCPAGTMWRR